MTEETKTLETKTTRDSKEKKENTRLTEVWSPEDQCWIRCSPEPGMRNLKRGHIFRLFEENGELVDPEGTVNLAFNDAKKMSNGIWVVQCEEIKIELYELTAKQARKDREDGKD